MAFAPTMRWKRLAIITLDIYPNRRLPTISAEQTFGECAGLTLPTQVFGVTVIAFMLPFYG